MKKPKLQSKSYLDFHDCTTYIEEKYKINTRDYENSNSQFNEWCDSKGYGDKDLENNKRGSSQIWYKEFKHEIEHEKIIERPYLDWWHWLINTSIIEIHNGVIITIDKDLKKYAKKKWEKDILDLYLKEFGNSDYLIKW